MNNTTYEWRRQLIWKHAQNPELGLPFQILATFWLFLCIIIGISANALVIRAFYQHKSVSKNFFKNRLIVQTEVVVSDPDMLKIAKNAKQFSISRGVHIDWKNCYCQMCMLSAIIKKW